MSKINNTIELNGKRYDSQTGAFLGTGSAVDIAVRPAPQGRRVQAVDGFLPNHTSRPKQHVATIPVEPTPLAHKSKPKAHHSAKAMAAHKPEHSKTLMRQTVKAPVVKSRAVKQLQAPTDVVKIQPKVLSVKPKLSSDNVDVARAERAHGVPRSKQVRRFQRQSHAIASSATAAAITQTPVAVPAPQQKQATEAPDRNMFERAIDNATSHEEPAPKIAASRKARRGVKRHVRAFSISAIVLAAVLLGGFIAYQNKIELQLQLASAKAGFPASMPGYHPIGYNAKSLTYGPGKVTIGYSGPSNKIYNVTQKSSNWDSQTLLQNYIATSGQAYDAYQAAGRTVYIYGNGNATWVSGGVWYQVTDNGALSKDQVIELANSM